MRKRPTGMTAEELKNLNAELKTCCHLLVPQVAAFNAETRGAAVTEERLQALESWHPKYVDADAKKIMIYAAMLALHFVGWIVEGALMATFALYIAVQFGGGSVLRWLLIPLFATAGVAASVGIGLLIDKCRVERNVRMERFLRKSGLLVCVLQPALILFMAWIIGSRSGANSKGTILTAAHLFWFAVIAGIINAILIYSTYSADGKAYWVFKAKQIALRKKVASHAALATEADAEADQTLMTLSYGYKSFIVTQHQPPILPELNQETEEWIRRRYRTFLAAPNEDHLQRPPRNDDGQP